MDPTITANMMGLPVVYEMDTGWRPVAAAPAPGDEEATARIAEEIARLNRLTETGIGLADSTDPAAYRPFLALPGLLFVARLGLVTDLKITADDGPPVVY